MDLIKLTSELIEFKSITPKDDGAIEFLYKILTSNGFKCKILKFGKNNKVNNLYASFKGGNGPNFCFAGHTDVVPAGIMSEWKTDPFKPKIINGKIFGRGTSDMKGAIAAFLSAGLKYIDSFPKFNGTISYLITGDEEGEAKYGTKKVLNWLSENKKKIDFCIVGEPTNPNFLGEMIKNGRRGSLNGEIEVFGIQGHVAYPEKAKNPIKVALLYCNELLKPLDNGNKIFEPSNLEITSIDVDNEIVNLIPSKVNIKFNVRFNNKFTSKTLVSEIRKRLNKVGRNYKLSVKVSGEAFHNSSEKLTSLLSQAIIQISNRKVKLSTSGGTSDARFISKFCPVIEFGLVGKTMHKVNENVKISDIKKLSEIYEKFLNLFFISQ